MYHQSNLPKRAPMMEWDESKTKQSEKDACDVNRIMARYKKDGVLPPSMMQGFYADVRHISDYRTAVHQVRQANAFFESLTAETRAQFDNDPAVFLDFASDPANLDLLKEMGLVEPSGAPEAPQEAKGDPEEASA